MRNFHPKATRLVHHPGHRIWSERCRNERLNLDSRSYNQKIALFQSFNRQCGAASVSPHVSAFVMCRGVSPVLSWMLTRNTVAMAASPPEIVVAPRPRDD